MQLSDLQKISDVEWEIPRDYRDDMRVAVRVFGTREMLEDIIDDKSLEQAVNATTLPGVVGHVYVMPDVHQGYGFPIGGVAATRYPEGVISPGAIGYDINCGVRLLSSSIPKEAAEDHFDALADMLDRNCPSGVGVGARRKLSVEELDDLSVRGTQWALEEGYATEEDLARTEAGGTVEGADPDKVSRRARERGAEQVGTLGGGNHFLELDLVEEVYHPEAAEIMGLEEGCLALMIHTGSRGYGHQICTDYVKRFQRLLDEFDIELPDRELVCAPMDSEDGQDYIAAMHCAANFAFNNRQVLAHGAREAFEEVLGDVVDDTSLRQVYDVAHNMGKLETHVIDGEDVRVCVHRKGATRAFGPGSSDLPDDYADLGQPVIVPGSMGTASWVLLGTEGSMDRSFGSTCHGAGRTMSRTAARKKQRGESLKRDLEGGGIRVRAGSMSGLAEEAPLAYKDVDTVVDAVEGADIARRVARLRPLGVVKG
jgi:tRNA-splicing ligase RtcB